MPCTSMAVKIVICAAITLLVVKLAVDQQRAEWRTKRLHMKQLERCSDILLQPDMRSDWPNWQTFADQLAQEIKTAEEDQVNYVWLCARLTC